MQRLVLTLCCLLAAGCSDGLATVDGDVTFNGEALSSAMIVLEPTDGKGAVAGANIEGGKFHIEKVLPGEKLVRIYASYPAGESTNIDNPTEKIVKMEELLPAEWHLKSTRKITVAAPETKETFEITGPDPRKDKKKK